MLGGSAFLVPLVAIAGLAFRAGRRSWTALVLLGASYAGGEAFFQILKAVIRRPRPPAALAIGHFAGTALPSGHATLSVAVWGMLAALAAGAAPRFRSGVAAWAGAAVIVVLVGLTRLYLGAHWLSDVLAGWALGALWLAALLVSTSRPWFSRRWPAFRSGSSSRSTAP